VTKTLKNLTKKAVLGLVIMNLVGCGGTNKVTELQGAGATFPYPLYSKMFDAYYKENGIKVNYQSIGSGGGIRQLKAETVDFGASDAFMSDKAMKASGKDILHIPVALGAVSLSYNVPALTNVHLTADVIADMFLGTINNWNDARIKALNPTAQLPNLDIATVHRSDGSGTTFIFTDYLAKVSQAWATKVGKGKAVNWPVGLGGKGNAGVAGVIQNIPGSIGYIGHIYAIQNNMPVVRVKNAKGHFIAPSLASVSQAANTALPADTRASITNSLAKKGYPISGFTWILAYKDQQFKGRSKEQAMATKALLNWMITDGQRFAEPLHYAGLTPVVVNQAQRLLDSMTFGSEGL